MENAEVLELTVKRVENILENRSQGKVTSRYCIDMKSVVAVIFQQLRVWLLQRQKQ